MTKTSSTTALPNQASSTKIQDAATMISDTNTPNNNDGSSAANTTSPTKKKGSKSVVAVKSSSSSSSSSCRTAKKRRVIDETKLSDIELKRLEDRRRYNRESAARSRKRTKDSMTQYKRKVKKLEGLYNTLSKEKSALEIHAANLEKQNQELRIQLLTLTNACGSLTNATTSLMKSTTPIAPQPTVQQERTGYFHNNGGHHHQQNNGLLALANLQQQQKHATAFARLQQPQQVITSPVTIERQTSNLSPQQLIAIAKLLQTKLP